LAESKYSKDLVSGVTSQENSVAYAGYLKHPVDYGGVCFHLAFD
jgi:hypothetical protein